LPTSASWPDGITITCSRSLPPDFALALGGALPVPQPQVQSGITQLVRSADFRLISELELTEAAHRFARGGTELGSSRPGAGRSGRGRIDPAQERLAPLAFDLRVKKRILEFPQKPPPLPLNFLEEVAPREVESGAGQHARLLTRPG
jgi:hypothetical protein